MKKDISMQDLNNLLKANKEGKIDLSNKEIEIIEKFKNGDTSVEQYKSILKHDIKILNNNNKLDKKLDTEFTDFCKEMKNKSAEEIFNSAYEITVKEELKDRLKNMELYPLEVNILLQQENILNEFYHDWLNVDTPLGEVLENSIEESIAMVTRYHKSNQKER